MVAAGQQRASKVLHFLLFDTDTAAAATRPPALAEYTEDFAIPRGMLPAILPLLSASSSSESAEVLRRSVSTEMCSRGLIGAGGCPVAASVRRNAQQLFGSMHLPVQDAGPLNLQKGAQHQ